jgi:hypothetical protein
MVLIAGADIVSDMREKLRTAFVGVGLHGESAPHVEVVGIVVLRVEHDALVLSPQWVLNPQTRDGGF